MNKRIVTLLFLLAELILYILILTTGGTLLVASSYIAIVLCFVYALLHIRQGDQLIIGGLFCTAMADWFLVVCSPIEQLWGMAFFLVAQILYAMRLHREHPSRVLLALRAGVTAVAMGIAALVLREKTDALALVSICYYANLIVNIVAAFARFRGNRMFAVGLVLFILCDTVIGLQMAAGVYLTIPAESLLHRIIFMEFHLSWFFYLPSQVLIALCSGKRGREIDV